MPSHDPPPDDKYDQGELISSVVKLPSGSERITDANEEIFSLYSDLARAPAQSGLGSVDPKVPTLEIAWTLQPPASIDDRPRSGKSGRKVKALSRPVEVTINIAQDPSSLQSRRGDTSSCVWRASLYFARLLLEQHYFRPIEDPPLLKLSAARILELGAGTGVLAALIGPLCAAYTATDQRPSLPLLRKNVSIAVEELDWLASGRPGASDPPFDVILAVDCIFNEALVQPLVSTLTAYASPQTVALVVMELRSSEVTEAFLEAWLATGRWTVWRVPSSALGSELGNGHYVVWAGQLAAAPLDRAT